MPISTANTILKYGIAQVETATIVGTITGAGNATVIVTADGVTGSPITFSVAVLLNDTASQVAEKIRTALELDANLIAKYTVGGDGIYVTLTEIVPNGNDTTLNISVANGDCTGLTDDTTSDATIAGVTYTKLVDITNYPDLGSTPSKLDTTTLTATAYKTSMLGLQEIPDLVFEANYDEVDYGVIVALSGLLCLRLEFGTAGAEGIFTWNGHIKVFVMGAGVDEVRKMQITASAETPISVA